MRPFDAGKPHFSNPFDVPDAAGMRGE